MSPALNRIIIQLTASYLHTIIAMDCGYPGAPKYGNFEPQRSTYSYEEGETVTYTCDTGYGLVYNPRRGSTRTCQCNGKWSNNIPVCSKDLSYDTALTVAGGENVPKLPKRKSPLNPQCTQDRNLPSSTSFELQRLAADGNTNNTDKLPQITLLQILLDNPIDTSAIPDPVTVSIRKNYETEGTPCEVYPRKGGVLVECRTSITNTGAYIDVWLKDGVWMDLCDWYAFNVEEVDCGFPEVPHHAMISKIDGRRYQFVCEEAYKLAGDPVQFCDPFNTYTPFSDPPSMTCVETEDTGVTQPIIKNTNMEGVFVLIGIVLAVVTLIITLSIILCILCFRRQGHYYSRPKRPSSKKVGRMNEVHDSVHETNKSPDIASIPNNIRTDSYGYEIPKDVFETIQGANNTNSWLKSPEIPRQNASSPSGAKTMNNLKSNNNAFSRSNEFLTKPPKEDSNRSELLLML